jgi:uncharacterized protein (TIGR03083 family)
VYVGPPVDATDYLRTLEADANLLADAARKGMDVGVPSCPDWTVADLVDHIARVHRWATQIVRDQLSERVAYPEPPPGVDILDWYCEGVSALLETLRSADPDAPAWNFTGGPHAAAFWQRRQALETAVHRWDAQRAHDVAEPIDPALAADGVDEMLGLFLPGLVASGRTPAPTGSLHVHLTDQPGEWSLRVVDGGVVVERDHAKADVAIRGGAHDVFLFVWGRRTGAVEVFGDDALLSTWQLGF